MRPNMGNIDRILRLILGSVLLAYALGLILPNSGWNWIGWIGLVPILTAFAGHCPAYKLLGIKTSK